MTDIRITNIQHKLNAIKCLTESEMPEGTIYQLLLPMLAERGIPYDRTRYGFNPGKAMLKHIFEMMRDGTQKEFPNVMGTGGENRESK